MKQQISTVQDEAFILARQLFPGKISRQRQMVEWLVSLSLKVTDIDVLIIHSPGGWGSANIKDLIDWELSIVSGVEKLLSSANVKWTLVQYLRASNRRWDHLKRIPEQTIWVLTGKSNQAYVVADGINFIKGHVKNLKIFLLGASQGAAFDNTVMKLIHDQRDIYSIELGIFFPHLRRRVTGENTLAIDSNGSVTDPVVHWNLGKALRAYVTAPFRWLKYKLAGEHVKFTYCINVPGHEYRWEYPNIRNAITDFIKAKLNKDLLRG
jgi:hypothetical protein